MPELTEFKAEVSRQLDEIRKELAAARNPRFDADPDHFYLPDWQAMERRSRAFLSASCRSEVHRV
jgi:hypothetical protein